MLTQESSEDFSSARMAWQDNTIASNENEQALSCKVPFAVEQSRNFACDIAKLQFEMRSFMTFQDRIEELLIGSDNRHAAMHATLEEFRSDICTSVTGVQTSTDAASRSLEERVDKLEQSLGDLVDQRACDVASLKAAHIKSANEAKARDGVHSSIADRIGYMERVLAGSSDAHTEDLAAVAARLEQVHIRLSVCESHGIAIEALQKSQTSLATDKNARDAFLSTLTEQTATSLGHHSSRFEQIEKCHAELAERYNQMLLGALQKVDQAHRTHAAHVTIVQEQAANNHAHHSSRFDKLERCHAEFTEAYDQRLLDALQKVEELQNKIEVDVNAMLSHLTSDSNAKESSRIEELERRHVEMVDQHSRAVADSCQKALLLQNSHEAHVNAVQTRLAVEQRSRELYEASMQDAFKANQESSEAQTRTGWVKHQENVNQRVDSLQRSLSIFEALISREIDERSRDVESIWNSIKPNNPAACAAVSATVVSQKTFRTTCRLAT